MEGRAMIMMPLQKEARKRVRQSWVVMRMARGVGRVVVIVVSEGVGRGREGDGVLCFCDVGGRTDTAVWKGCSVIVWVAMFACSVRCKSVV